MRTKRKIVGSQKVRPSASAQPEAETSNLDSKSPRRSIINQPAAFSPNAERPDFSRQKHTPAASKAHSLLMLKHRYVSMTPPRVRLIDALVIICLCLSALQILYRCIVGSFPYNSFLAGVVSTVGVAVLGTGLRMQLTSPWQFRNITAERAITDFLVCCLVLFIGTTTFLG